MLKLFAALFIMLECPPE